MELIINLYVACSNHKGRYIFKPLYPSHQRRRHSLLCLCRRLQNQSRPTYISSGWLEVGQGIAWALGLPALRKSLSSASLMLILMLVRLYACGSELTNISTYITPPNKSIQYLSNIIIHFYTYCHLIIYIQYFKHLFFWAYSLI